MTSSVDGILAAAKSAIAKEIPGLTEDVHKKIQDSLQAQLPNLIPSAPVTQDIEDIGSMFISGWRPLIGWICAIGLGYNTIILVLIKSLLALGTLIGLSAEAIARAIEILPHIDMTLLGSILMQMIGMGWMGTLRTVEKLSGVARTSIPPNPPTSGGQVG